MQVELEIFGVNVLRFFVGNPFSPAEPESIHNTGGEFSIPFGFASPTTYDEEE